jgi:hypothetical protein
MIDKREIFLWSHLGLGDAIICNAIYRHYAKEYDLVHIFVKNRNLANVKYMLRDLNNINYISGYGDQDEFVKQYLDIHRYIPLLKIGHEYLNHTKLNFDEAFYEQVKIPFEKRYTDFYVERDLETEEKLCNILNPTGESYIFVHQDTDRGYPIHTDYIKNKNLKIIESNYKFDDIKEYLIFHYLKFIENAEEVHVMESSFKNMINFCINNKENVYLHKYARGVTSSCKSYWNIIE